jgi:anthranilate synthase component 2
VKALLVDAYDSFVHIINQYLMEVGIETRVIRNDKIQFDRDVEQAAPDFIVLGPGPGHPADSGYVQLIHRCGGKLPILGVCLGHQAIGLAFGGKIERTKHLMHGKPSMIRHDQAGCFTKQKSPFSGNRYHSLVVADDSFPDILKVTARAEDDGYIMGLRHKVLPIESIQFHPESILTETGMNLFTSFISCYVGSSQQADYVVR